MNKLTVLTIGLVLVGLTWGAGSVRSIPTDPEFAQVVQARVSGSTLMPDNETGPNGQSAFRSGRDFAAEAAVRPAQPATGPEPAQSKHALDFGTDVLISNFPGGLAGSRLSIDHAANGDIYVGVFSPNAQPQDTFYVYRSTDGGATWALWHWAQNTSGDDSIVDGQVLVGPGTNPWVYMFTHYATSAGGLYVLRMRADLSSGTWIKIAGGDTVRYFAADRNVESPETYFLTYRRTAPTFQNLALFASADSAETWTGGRWVTDSTADRPAVCAGGDGYVYISFLQTDSTKLRVGRYTNNLISPTFVFTTIDSSGEYSFTPSVAAGRTAPGDSQSAWVLNRHLHPAGYDIHVSTTTDGGATWSTGPWPISNATHSVFDYRFPMLRVGYDYSVSLTAGIGVLYGLPFDSLMTGWSYTDDPFTWNEPMLVNDYDATGEVNPAIDLANSTFGDAITYRPYGVSSVYFDWWTAPTAVSERSGLVSDRFQLSVAPNPAPEQARISYALAAPGSVDLSVYDLSGKLVARLVNGTGAAGAHRISLNTRSLAAGVYLARLSAGGASSTARFVVTR